MPDLVSPQTLASGWSAPVKVSAPVNTNCPEDAVEISRDGQTLYFLWTPDLGKNLSPSELLLGVSGTYYCKRTGGPGEFSHPKFYNLRQGAIAGAYDGELSFTPAGDRVFFHSTRAENTGYNSNPYVDDPMDIYVSTITAGVPGPAVNAGNTINSSYRDGEHCLSPDGQTLYFSSDRPGGYGGVDIWYSTWNTDHWSTPVNMGSVINSPGSDMQPAFAANYPDTIYFASDRSGTGFAIYRSTYNAGNWSVPEIVIQGQCAEPSLTADGSIMYFVHILTDSAPDPVFGADIYYVIKQ